MKYLFAISLLFFTACAHLPRLQEGSCYKSTISGNSPNEQQFLTSFKIINVVEINDSPVYTIQPLDLWGDPIYPGTRYTHTKADLLDEYLAPIVYQFNFYDPDKHAVKCNPVKDFPPLSILGRKP